MPFTLIGLQYLIIVLLEDSYCLLQGFTFILLSWFDFAFYFVAKKER